MKSWTRWTKDEDNIIRKYYPSEGMNVLARLPGRTRTQLLGHIYYMGLYYLDHKPRKVRIVHRVWADEELSILKKYYVIEGPATLKRLPGRSLGAMRMKASQLGLSNNSKRFTEEEDSIILKHYPSEGTLCAMRLYGRSRRSIEARARALGVKFGDIKEQRFTEEDTALIRKHYANEGAKGLFNRLSGRFTIKEINRKANRMGLKRKRKDDT